MLNKIKIYALSFLLTAGFFSCKNCSQEKTEVDDANNIIPSLVLVDSSAKCVKVKAREINANIFCNGKIDVPVYQKSLVSPRAKGYVKKLNYAPGDFVAAGSIMAVLEHIDYINLQEEYLQCKGRLNFLKENFKRQGELTLENATSIKKFQETESLYLQEEAKFLSLKAKLLFLGINPENVRVEGITTAINIYAPISGYITDASVSFGELVKENDVLYEITDKNKLKILLNVDAKDISRVYVEQDVQYQIAGLSHSLKTKIEKLGTVIEKSSQKIEVFASVDKEDLDKVKPGMFVSAIIESKADTVFTLPVKYVLQEGQSSYVFIKTMGGHQKIKVETGIQSGEYVEIITPLPDKEILMLSSR